MDFIIDKKQIEYVSSLYACHSIEPIYELLKDLLPKERGKNHSICSKFCDKTAEKYKPRYGCGKCQVGVPCESRIPIQYKTKWKLY